MMRILIAIFIFSLVLNLLQILNTNRLMKSIENLHYTQSVLEAHIAELEASDGIKTVE